jgi:hypothetical protein
VILVLRAGKTRRAAAIDAQAQLAQLGLKLRGVVLNDVKRRDQSYGRDYYYNYYRTPADTIPNKNAVNVVRTPSSNGQRLARRQPGTAPLNGRPPLPLDAIRSLKPDELLLMIGGSRQLVTVSVTEQVTLGRVSDDMTSNHVALDDYGAHQLGVSRMHAALHRRDDEFFLEDLGSANGTWINDQCLNPREAHALSNNDNIRLGDMLVWVYYRVESAEAGGGHDVTEIFGASQAE